MVVGATNGKATAALVCGIGSFIACGPVLGIPAIILGRMASNEIRASGGAQSGDGMAKAGFILGIVNVVLSVVVILGYLVILAAVIGSAPEGGYDSFVATPAVGAASPATP